MPENINVSVVRVPDSDALRVAWLPAESPQIKGKERWAHTRVARDTQTRRERSGPFTAKRAAVAQMVEQCIRNARVGGSSPSCGTGVFTPRTIRS